MQGVVRREYRAYSQGPQRGSGVHGDLPKGAPHGARGRVAPLGNGADHSRRGRALPQTPWDALKRHNSRDTTLVLSCFLPLAAAAQDSVPVQESRSVRAMNETAGRSTDDDVVLKNSNLETLGDDYYRPLESEPVRTAVDAYILNIACLCKKTQLSFEKRLDLLHKELVGLVDLTSAYLRQRLKLRDSLYLGGMRDVVRELIVFIEIEAQRSPGGQSENLLNNFISYYHFYDHSNPSPRDESPEHWARQIYSSFECLPSNNQ